MVRRVAMLGLATAVIFCAAGGALAASQYDYLLAPATACGGGNQTDMTLLQGVQARTMLCLHNWARKRASGEPPLHLNHMLMKAALAQAKDIMRCRPQALTHTPCGEPLFYRVRQSGYESTGCYGVGENIAFGTGRLGTIRSIMDAWLNSAPHRENILTASYRDAGFAFVRGTFEGYRNATVRVAELGYRC